MNGIVLAGIAWLVTLGPGTQSKSLLPSPSAKHASTAPVDMSALEARASLAPSVESVTALASAYLDQEQPGLACAAVEAAPRKIQLDARVADVHARALFRGGRARQALAAVEDARAACDSEETACRAWQVAKVERQAAFLKEVVAAGIEDPMSDPNGVRAAYERSNQRLGVVAMR